MIKRPKDAGQQQELDDLPPVDDFYEQFAKDHAHYRTRVWLYPYLDAEPTLELWIEAFAAFDDPERRDQAKLAVLVKSDHPLEHYAHQYLIHFLKRYQEPLALCPQLLVNLKSGAKLSRDDRASLADLLEQKPWKRTKGNRPPAYEETAAEFDLAVTSAAVYDLVNQGKELTERLDQRMAKGMSLEQAFDKVKNRTWSV